MTVLDELRLDGKVAIVTGGSRGIGGGLALGLAEAGADVALVARTAAELEQSAARIRALGRRVLAVPTDVSDLQALGPLVDKVAQSLGRLDILVNAAGVNRRLPVLDISPADWDYVLNTNLRAVYFVSQAVGRLLTAQRSGKIINIASMTTYRGFSDLSLYSISKTAVAAVTRNLAVEWAPYNVQVNAIAPGWIETPMTASMTAARRRWVEEHVPQGQFGQPKDLAGVCVYLASAASNYTTGQVIPVDGGFMAGNPWAPQTT